MGVTVEVTGLNLERLLTAVAQSGILIKDARRVDPRSVRLGIRAADRGAMEALCARCGWEMRVVSKGLPLRMAKGIGQRPMLLVGAMMYVLLMAFSSNMIWRVRIDHADKAVGEIRTYLAQSGIRPGCLKRTVQVSKLREALMLRLPDLAHVSVRYAGSVLVIDCQPALEGETWLLDGSGWDIVAAQDGLITGILAHSGTPAVQIGQAVRAGDVLIRGEERGEKGTVHPVKAQGEVTARVWKMGDAKVSRYRTRTVETGSVRRRITVVSPWHIRCVQDAQPFDNQDVSVEIQPVVGLYLPLVRRVETFAEVEIIREERSLSDAHSMAQGAAQQAAKNKCPAGVHILDKSVENSMIDNEYVYATVVLEYESDIAVRAAQDAWMQE